MESIGALVLSGRSFRPPTKTTLEQDLYILERFRAAGMEDSTLELSDENKLVAATEKMLIQAYSSGTLFELLAGMLVEDGVKWSPQQARQNAEFFANLEEPEDKANIQSALVGTVLSFFFNAPESSKTFPKSSARAKAQGAVASEGESEGITILESGETSSGS